MKEDDTVEGLRRRLAEAERDTAVLRAVLESIGDAVYVGGQQGVTLANQPALDQLGFTTTQDLNRDIRRLSAELLTRDGETGIPIPDGDLPFARALSGERVVRDLRVRHRLSGEERLVRCSASPVVLDGRVVGAVAVNTDVTERRRADEALRESEERQAFLLKLSDALRPLADPVDVMGAASEALGRYLDVGRCGYGEVDETGEFFIVERDWTDGVMPSFKGTHHFPSFGLELVERYRAGRSVLIDDALADARAAGHEAAFERAGGVRASLGLPLIKEGRFVAGFFVQQLQPRHWTVQDEALALDVAERTWAAVERARAEDGLRKSEARFQQFATSSADALWIRDAATLEMEYVSPAIEAIYGVQPESILGDPKHWGALIVPEDRDIAFEHLERARAGEAVVHEFRILRSSDQTFRWIRNTDFPLRDERGRVQRIGGIAQDVTEAKLAAEHGRVLLLELQHRVRNIMAMIRSVADRTGDTACDADDYRDRLQGRLSALSRVQTLLTREANAGVDLATLVDAEVSAQAEQANQYTLTGPRLQLAPKAAEVVTLAIHELATNALKYGAFSHAAGRLAVLWQIVYVGDQSWLRLDWVEAGAPAPLSPPRREGFGTALIRERIPYELNGRGSLSVEPDGLRCRLEFPLRAGDSILETDTVTLSTGIAGGSLEMAGEVDLGGSRVLVVEDDYYLAKDTSRALAKAGGAVLGPVGNEADALALIAGDRPDGALVDINLGDGARFVVAGALQDAGVPFAFVTGYDDAVIPARFDGVERLRKPIELKQLVRTAARMCAE